MANELTKMFVHYSGTVQEFKNANLETKYNKQIVFIKGGTNGNGEAVYTHGKYYGDVKAAIAALTQQVNDLKYFTSISDGTKTASASGKNGVITFNAVDPTQVAVEVDSNGVTIGLTDAFKKSVSDNTTNVANVRADLGNVGDQANSKGSAFARIANLAAVVGQLTGAEGGELKSVESQITEAIEALRAEIVGTLEDADAKTLQAINDELDAVDAKWASYISKAELATEVSDNDGVKVNVTVKTKDGKVSDVVVNETQLEDALNLKANAADVYTKTDADAMAQGKVDTLANNAVRANTDAIAKLNGNSSVAGSVDKKIVDAIDAFAAKVSDNGTIDTLKELVDYVAGVDGSDKLTSAIAQIADNKGKIETLNGNADTVGSVAKSVKDAIDAEVGRAEAAYAVKGTEGVASGAAARAEEAFALAGQKATAAEAKAEAVTAISEIAEASVSDSDNSYVKATVTTKAGSVTAVVVDDSGVKTCADNARDEAKGYTDTVVGKYTATGVTASGVRKEIEDRDAAILESAKAYVDALLAWEEL